MSDFQLGKHEQAITLLLQGQERVEAAISRIESQLAEQRGARKALLWGVATGSSFLSSIITLVARSFLTHGKV